MANSPIKLHMPEAGGEHEEVYIRHHGCPEARFMQRELGAEAEECDFLLWPVGLAGYEIPQGIPFDVTALEPCGACGRTLTAWFVWESASVHVLGQK